MLCVLFNLNLAKHVLKYYYRSIIINIIIYIFNSVCIYIHTQTRAYKSKHKVYKIMGVLHMLIMPLVHGPQECIKSRCKSKKINNEIEVPHFHDIKFLPRP